MEQRLKKERNQLLLRIILILLAVWLAVSAVFCAVRLNTEKVNIQNDELSKLNRIKRFVIVGEDNLESVEQFFPDEADDGGKTPQKSFDTQIILTDRSTNKIVADTANTIGVYFTVKTNTNLTGNAVGMLDYDDVRGALSDSEYEEIAGFLNTERDDGDYYELVCTRFFPDRSRIVPTQLKIVLVSGADTRITLEEAAVYELNADRAEGKNVYDCGSIRRNTIPKEFILDGVRNKDIIGTLSKEQRKSNVAMIRTGALKYVFYASDYLNYYQRSADEDASYDTADDNLYIQYAREVDLLDSCKTALLSGVMLILGFILTIGAILCVMIWHTVRAQLVQEQKRLDLTNALAHDIKTPLFVISGYAYSLKENIDESEREVYIDRIIEQTEEVNGLIHRMLNFSKLDSYSMTLSKTEFDLCALTKDILKKYTALPDSKRIVFTHSGDNKISADSELIRSALQNLIDNAVKYSPPDSEIQVGVNDQTFTVGNRTEPLTKAELKQIWKPYVRKDKSRHQKGNGLGLSIVKSILDLHEAEYHMEMKEEILICRVTFR